MRKYAAYVGMDVYAPGFAANHLANLPAYLPTSATASSWRGVLESGGSNLVERS